MPSEKKKLEIEKHAFISYAHIDNEPISKEDEGWISEFHDSLKKLLAMKLGEEVGIWRDNKLDGSDIFSDEIIEQLRKAEILISILTPRYINSEWCNKEIKEFYDSAAKSFGIRIGNKSRILKVLKTPVEREKIPPEISGNLGYEFYKLDKNGRPKEFNKLFGGKAEKAYLNKLDDLAFDIKEILSLLHVNKEKEKGKHSPKATLEADSKVRAIYVAQTSSDLYDERDQIVRELKDHGYQVLPDKSLPIVEEELSNEVSQYLDQCQMAIHLFGESYGFIPEGPSKKSANELQKEITASASEKSNLPRIIWMPKDLDLEDEKQRKFVTLLTEDNNAHDTDDLIEGSLEDLKAVMHDKINQINTPTEIKESAASNTKKNVYLICDARDNEFKLTRPLRKYLSEQNIKVTMPLFKGDPSAIRQDQEENLKTCDAIIIFYGKGEEAWKNSKLNELKKINTLKRTKPLLANYIYYAEPITLEKEDEVDEGEANLIDGLYGFSPDILSDFMKNVTQP